MNLPLGVDLFSEPELAKAIGTPGKDLGKVRLERQVISYTFNGLLIHSHFFR